MLTVCGGLVPSETQNCKHLRVPLYLTMKYMKKVKKGFSRRLYFGILMLYVLRCTYLCNNVKCTYMNNDLF